MTALAATGVLALVVCASALAKFQISVAASDTTPAVDQRVTLVVRSEQRLDYNLRLIAVVPLVRLAPDRWRGTARFRTTGRWRVIVPNGAPVGVAVPAGVARLTLAVH